MGAGLRLTGSDRCVRAAEVEVEGADVVEPDDQRTLTDLDDGDVAVGEAAGFVRAAEGTTSIGTGGGVVAVEGRLPGNGSVP
jgi:hypothetical protein